MNNNDSSVDTPTPPAATAVAAPLAPPQRPPDDQLLVEDTTPKTTRVSTTTSNNDTTLSTPSTTVTPASTSSYSPATNSSFSIRRSHKKDPPPTSFNAMSCDTDKARVLRLIQQEGKAKQIWKYLPEIWKHDKELILAALNNHTAELPGKSDFERTFPQSLRFDRDIVLAFCHRPDFTLKKTNKKKKNKTRKDKQSRRNTNTNTTSLTTISDHDDNEDDNASNESDEDRGLYYERHLFVPGCLTNDKQVMMAYCQKIPRSLQDCSEELCNDRDIVTAAITNCSGLELQYASVALQQDIDMVKLACANHGRSLEFCPLLSPTHQALVQDRDFMLNVVLNNPGGGPMWKLLPVELQQNDEELLLRALTNGLLLRDVPQHYLTLDFLTKAIQKNCRLYLQLKTIKMSFNVTTTNDDDPTAQCPRNPSPVVKHRHHPTNNNNHNTKWHHHSTLALAAIVSETSTPEIHAAALDGCPTLQESRPVVMAICQRGCIKMLQDILGPTTDPNDDDNNNNNNVNNNNNNVNINIDDVALAAVVHFNMGGPPPNPGANEVGDDPAAAAVEPPPDFLAANARGMADPIHPRVFRDGPPPEPFRHPHRHHPVEPPRSHFCNDMEVMKLAVQRDPGFFAVASPRLQANPELIMVSITRTSAWNTLKTVPWSIQREHPEITVKAINLCQSLHLRYIPTHIPEEMWTNHREVCMAWIGRGGRILDVFERMLRNDTEMALLVAKHNWAEFYKVGDRLLNDYDFVLQALPLDGRVFRFVSPTLRQNFDVMIMAVASYYNKANVSQLPSVAQSFAGMLDLEALKQEIKRLLDLHDMYVQQFLRGISIKTPHLAPALRSQLTLLDRGVETSEAFKRLIAEYLGVPVGPKLSLLRRADENIKRPHHHSNASAVAPSAWDEHFLFRNAGDGGAAAMDRFDRLAYRRFRWMARRRRPMMDNDNINNNNNNNDDNNHINNESDNDDDDDDDDDEQQYFWIPRSRRRRPAAGNGNNNNDGGNSDNNRHGGEVFWGMGAAVPPPNNVGNGNDDNGVDNNDHRLIPWRRRDRYYGRVLMGNDGDRDAQHREEMRRMMRADREAAYSAMRARQEVLRDEMQGIMPDDLERPRPNAVHASRARQYDHERRLQEVMADVERTQRQVDERMHMARHLAQEEGYARAIAAAVIDDGEGNVRPPDVPLFGFDSMVERDRTESGKQQDATIREERELRLELERRRRSDEMLARLEARNARYRAAERGSNPFNRQNVDDDDVPRPLVARPPRDLFALDFDDLDDDISDDMSMPPDL
jgi:hypothetical protein